MSETLTQAILFALIAGATIPLGAGLAVWDKIHPNWMSGELRHGVVAFGGGVLIAAVALVLIPEGVALIPGWMALAAFISGGVSFFFIDRTLGRSGQSMGQLMAMLVDYLPEAIALGAMLATGAPAGLLLALLIGLQNFPEAFNAYRERAAHSDEPAMKTYAPYLLMPLLGPIAAILGVLIFAPNPMVLGVLMVCAAGGVLFLTFQDVAPEVKLERRWAPPLGAVLGFTLGLAGDVFL
ncbi:MAG: divalent cation transporter [Oceanicaulis sp.]|nr:divalent cation transporter [Oceanicaulis sp.]